MNTTIGLMTAEDLWHMPEDHMRHELVKGELITMPPAGAEHGAIGINLAVPLTIHVKAIDWGRVFNGDTGFLICHDPDTVRALDVAGVRKERISSIGLPKKYFPGAPDVAGEVISPDDRLTEVEDKVHEWLTAGTQLVWVINPRRHTVTVYTSPNAARILTRNDELLGLDVIPGFRLPVRDLFV